MNTPPQAFWDTGQTFLVTAPLQSWESIQAAAIAYFAISPFDVVIVGEDPPLSIEEARFVRSESHKRPYQGKTRLSIIQSIDQSSLPAVNALLKVLEEPIATTRFLLLAETKQVLPTIRSRASIWSADTEKTMANDRLIPLEKDADFGTVSLRIAEITRAGMAIAVVDDWTHQLLQSPSSGPRSLQWLIEIRDLLQHTAINTQAILETTYVSLVHDQPLPASIEKILYKDHGHI